MSPTPFQRLCRCRCQCCYHFFFRYSLCARDCTALITHPFASVTPHKFSNAKAMAVSVVHESQCNFPRNLQRHVFCGAHPSYAYLLVHLYSGNIYSYTSPRSIISITFSDGAYLFKMSSAKWEVPGSH